MGTSSIFNGRNDRNPLIPDDYDGNTDNEDSRIEPVKWQTVKSDMSKYIRSGGSYGTSRHIAQQYVKASGGAHRMAMQSVSGKKAAASFGHFFNSIKEHGIEETLHHLGIEFTGKSINEVFSRLLDALAPDSDTKEDIVAKEAVEAALEGVYDYVEENGLDIGKLNSMPVDLANNALCEYIGSYIWISMMKDLGSRLEIHLENSSNAHETEQEFKDMILEIVKVEFEKKGDIVNQNVASAMTDLHEQCLKVLEGVI